MSLWRISAYSFANIGSMGFRNYYIFALIAVLLVVGVILLIRKGNRDPGAVLYQRECMACHMEDGSGLEQLYPPLANSDWLRDNQDTLACIIRNGIQGPMVVNGREYDGIMAPHADLTDGQIYNIITYINAAWGNDLSRPNLAEVKEQLARCGE